MNYSELMEENIVRTLTYPLMLIAGTGFVLSAVTHVMSLLGQPLPGGSLVWVLHVGIFVVWFPAILLNRTKLETVDRKHQWDAILANCPRWMRRALGVLFAYA